MKKYTVKCTALMTDWTCSFDITDEAKALESARLGSEFFSGHEDRLMDEDGDIIKAYLKFVGQQIMTIARDYTEVDSVNRELASMEGFFTLDGTHGIRLTNVDSFEFAQYDFEVEEESTN